MRPGAFIKIKNQENAALDAADVPAAAAEAAMEAVPLEKWFEKAWKNGGYNRKLVDLLPEIQYNKVVMKIILIDFGSESI